MLTKKDGDKRNGTADEIIAFLGKGTRFKGVVTYDGTVRIDGHIEGEVISTGTLIVGETAVIDAEVTVGSLICGGKITGNITATERVQLLNPASVTGSIKTPVLMIEAGVRFNGQCEMKGDSRAEMIVDHEPLAIAANDR
ncbi:MAG TPA: polymer-forming cytoskeletal protein [Nitrospiria bacterium]|nr:polymer-forming cytoskeletal protein [Nitrospiria bacterium]